MQKLSDADAKQMALDMDKKQLQGREADGFPLFRYAGAEAEMRGETTYIDNGGATFVTAHAFDAE